MIYSPDGDTLCIVYSNSNIDMIDTNSFECVYSYEGIQEVYQSADIGNKHFALIGINETYIFEKESRCRVADISGYLAYNSDENVFYISGRDGVYTIPFYTYEQVIEKGKVYEK